MLLRSTISLISKDPQARKTLVLFNGTQCGVSSRSSASSSSFSSSSVAEEDEAYNVRDPNLSVPESMQGVAQRRSHQIDFELQDYIQIAASSSTRLFSPSPSSSVLPYRILSSSSSSSLSTSSSSSPQPLVKEDKENFFSRTWANIKKASPSRPHLVSSLSSSSSSLSSSSNIKNKQRIRDSRSNLPIKPDSPAFQDLPYPPRVWQRAPQAENEQESFVVTSFNVLASTYAHQHRSLYPYVPDVLLSWSSRKKRILQELDFASPDIICLQEVDRFRDLAEDLTSRGYVGLFKLRTGAMPDGCAIFWRKARFQLLQERSFEFSMLGMRNNVAQLCVLERVGSGIGNSQSPMSRVAEGTQNRILIVGNIHVLFNPKRGEIKLGQCRAFLEQAHNMSSIWQGAPVVIGGDFNSTPSSAVYKFLATSTLDLSNLDRRYLSGQVVETASDCKLLRRASLQKEILEETHVNCFRSDMITQVKENELTSNHENIEEVFFDRFYQYHLCPDISMVTWKGSKQSNDRSMDSSAQHTEVTLKESHFSASSGSELLVAETCSLSITKSSILQGDCSQLVHSDDTDLCKASLSYSKAPLVSGLSQNDEGIREELKWGLEELRVATGNIDCTVMHHKLNLCSVYAEVPGQPNTRDSFGEPLLTTCHKEFTGTVDYIWRSVGLKTVKVLDTVPLNTFARNKGLPLKLWGSDHLPISCELAFDQNV